MPKLISQICSSEEVGGTDETRLERNSLNKSKTISAMSMPLQNLPQQLQLQKKKRDNRKSKNEKDNNKCTNEKNDKSANITFVESSEEESFSLDECNLCMINDPRSKRDELLGETSKNAKHIPFPKQLHDILSNEAYYNIIRWLPHGKSFVILKKQKFVEAVSTKYFKETKYTSFTRKLNRWQFIRVSRGPDTGAYHHKFFLRDDPSKSSLITCRKKHEPKALRSGVSKMKNAAFSAQHTVKTVSIRNEAPSNDFTSSSFSSSFPLETIKKAQMEQVERRRFLNYLSSKQQYEFQRNMNMRNHQYITHISNDACKSPKTSLPYIPGLQDANVLNFSPMLLSNINKRQQQQLRNKISPVMLPKTVSVPILPTISTIPIHEPEDENTKGPDLKIANIPNQLQPKYENHKLSLLADLATRMSLSPKECYDENVKCNLPIKKRNKRRFSDDESNGSVHSRSGSIRSKDEISPIRRRASAA